MEELPGWGRREPFFHKPSMVGSLAEVSAQKKQHPAFWVLLLHEPTAHPAVWFSDQDRKSKEPCI
jgi:hypothetical protein